MPLRNLNRTISTGRILGTSKTGIKGSLIPSIGDSGPSFLYNDLNLPTDDSKEVRGEIITFPSSGTLATNEDGSFTYTAVSDGTYGFTYQLYVDGVATGSPTSVTLNVGAGDIPTLVSYNKFSTTTTYKAYSVSYDQSVDYTKYLVTETFKDYSVEYDQVVDYSKYQTTVNYNSFDFDSSTNIDYQKYSISTTFKPYSFEYNQSVDYTKYLISTTYKDYSVSSSDAVVVTYSKYSVSESFHPYQVENDQSVVYSRYQTNVNYKPYTADEVITDHVVTYNKLNYTVTFKPYVASNIGFIYSENPKNVAIVKAGNSSTVIIPANSSTVQARG